MMVEHARPPYEIEHLDDDHVILRLPEILDEPRTEEHGIELEGLVAGTRTVAVDASRSTVISSDWIRYLLRLSTIAEQSGKLVGIVGLSGVPEENADLLGIKNKLELFDSLEEVWKE